jgi:hypothetical protein
MARFWGEVQGARGAVSRLGNSISGLVTTAASWRGAVRVAMSAHDDADTVSVTMGAHQGAGPSPSVLLFAGRVESDRRAILAGVLRAVAAQCPEESADILAIANRIS